MPILTQVQRRRASEPSLLVAAHGVCAAAVAFTAAVADLHEDDFGAMFHHEIDLAQPATEIPFT